jgi:HAD superfamily hydrolase (TIGR01662 family)
VSDSLSSAPGSLTPRAVLFDFYNTLGARAISDRVLEQEALLRLGYEIPPERLSAAIARAWAPLDGATQIEHSAHSGSAAAYRAWCSQIERAWLSDLGIDPCSDALLDALYAAYENPDAYRFFDDVAPTLDALRRRGFALGVVSNWSWELPAIFERAGLAESVDLLITSARCGYRKPHPGIYHCALRQLGLAPSEVLFVGDNPHADVDGPRAVGMSAILIDRAGSVAGCERISRLDELLRVLPERAGSA